MQMTADKAAKYEFSRTCNLNKTGVESFQHIFLQLGASSAHITKEYFFYCFFLARSLLIINSKLQSFFYIKILEVIIYCLCNCVILTLTFCITQCDYFDTHSYRDFHHHKC